MPHGRRTAPGVECQAEAIALAHAVAGVDPDSIGYVEAHGSGTPLGDAIEFEALDQAFGRLRPDRPFCGLCSVKSNVGHLENAAGVTGLIKAALALQRGVIRPVSTSRPPTPRSASTARRSSSPGQPSSGAMASRRGARA